MLSEGSEHIIYDKPPQSREDFTAVIINVLLQLRVCFPFGWVSAADYSKLYRRTNHRSIRQDKALPSFQGSNSWYLLARSHEDRGHGITVMEAFVCSLCWDSVVGAWKVVMPAYRAYQKGRTFRQICHI